jgi:hypothetical protein
MSDDDDLQFPPQRMARHDAEVAADVGDDGADGAAANPGCDLLGRGQADFRVYPRIKSGGGGGRRLTVRGSARWRGFGVYAGGCADDPDFECLGKEQAPGDAREDQGDIAGAERVGIGAERGGDLPAVVDEPADEAEEAAGAAGSASRNFFLDGI